jgi:argininosuccinate lyase
MDETFARFNASVAFDRRFYAQDIRGSIAHVRMLGRQGIIAAKEARTIEDGLLEVLDDIETGNFQFKEELEDVHVNIETALRQKIGDVAGKLHTARSRNDQVVLDFRMYLRDQTALLTQELLSLLDALVSTAESKLDAILPGYTHLQRAQPVRLAHNLLAYFEMFQRDLERFKDSTNRLNRMPLGSAALAGTTFDIDREGVAEDLGFPEVSTNSMDAVSDRDFAAEFLFNGSMTMMHLSRLAEELILWSSQEFGFCSLPDAYCSGSSIMPQKKNPDACELIRGKTGRVYGDLVALLTVLKALPLTYNKDLQEDKEPVFDCVDTVRGSLRIMAGMLPGIVFHEGKMLEAASDPALAATDLADRLAGRGIPFREAHERIGAMIREQTEGGQVDSSEGEIPTPVEMVEARRQIGGTARKRVLEQIESAREYVRTSAIQFPSTHRGGP